ncbi:MAG: SDR family NAD(P)-dependent oxidoreductase [Chlorobi bacterium]|nr:SDR family NAD(P)-dependent oxidoreductase [Chlorobiota bacterium]
MNSLKTVLVTGGTGAIGKAIAKLIARKPGYEVVILARNPQKAQDAVEELTRITGNKHINYVLADLSRKEEIKKLADSWDRPLHILINNAGVTPRRREETPEGIEMQWATNVLGYFRMMKYFIPRIKDSAPARIVNVASYWAGGLDPTDPEFKYRYYNNDTAYRQSKQADRMLTVAFAEMLKMHNITVNVCHPGDVPSTLSANLGFSGHETPEEGADTPVWLATSPELEGITGKYFEHRQLTNCSFGQNKEKVEKLFELCDRY